MWMLDTDMCIYLIKRRSPTVIRKLQERRPTEVCISSITMAELQYGVEKSEARDKNASALVRFLAPLDILHFDHNAAIAYGQVRAHLERKGRPIGALDTLIGAHALSAGATLVTNNVREFRRLPGLKVENWARR